jgi:hypothetical protein
LNWKGRAYKSKQDDSAEAVRVAMQDYLRHARRMQLRSLSGRVEMMDNWQELEQAELNSQHSLESSLSDPGHPRKKAKATKPAESN